MSVLQRVNFAPNERWDTPDARSLEAFGLNDWRFFLSGFLSDQSYILHGFELTNFTSIFSVPGLSLSLSSVALFHSEATTQAAGFYVSAGTEQDVSVNLSSSATNYIEADLTSVSGTPDVRAFWDQGANAGAGGEFTDTIDTVINLELTITSNITGFTSGKIPLYRVITDSSGVVTSLTDCRNLLFRLGTGGSSPNPDFSYDFPELPDASHSRLETSITAMSPVDPPYQGGDKNFRNFKDWMNVVMTLLKEIKGVPYWYMVGGGSSTIPGAYQNAAMIVFAGGTWQHLPSPTAAGHLALVGGSVIHRLGLTNNATLNPFADINLITNRVLFVILPTTDSAVAYDFGEDSATPIIPKAVTGVSASTITVNLSGNYILAGGKVLVHGQEYSYTSYTAGTGLFSGVSPDPSSLVTAGDLVYQVDDSGVGYYHTSVQANVPGVIGSTSAGAERTIWLAYFDGSNTIELKNSDMLQGEEINVGDETSQNLLRYIGAPDDATDDPTYATTATDAKTGQTSYNTNSDDDLTVRASVLTSMMADKAQDKTIKIVRQGITDIVNTTNGSNQELTFTGGAAFLHVIVPGSANNGSIALIGTLSLAVNQAAWFEIDRNASFSLGGLVSLTVGPTTSVPLGENVFIFAARLSSVLVYLWDGSRINVGTWPSSQILSKGVREHIGITGESSYENYSSTNIIALIDTHPAAISLLDSAIYDILTDTGAEESQLVGVGGTTTFTATNPELLWDPSNAIIDIQVYINGRKAIQDITGGLLQDYRKTSTTALQFAFTVPENARITVRIERTGGGGTWSVPVNAHIVPTTDNTYDLGTNSKMFRDGYFAGKLTVIGGIDPAYIQLAPQPNHDDIPLNSLWIDSSDSGFKIKGDDGNSEPVGSAGTVTAPYLELQPQDDDTGIPDNSLWVDGGDSNTLKFKATGGTSSPIGETVTASNFLQKTMQNKTFVTIAAGKPVAKLSDGSIVPADSDGVSAQKYVGITMVSIAALATGAVLLPAPNVAGAVTGLGFAPGDDVYLSESGGFTNNPNSFSGSNDSIIRVGIADCSGGTASSTANDLIMLTEVLLRP